MDLKKLRHLEDRFLSQYPLGFESPELLDISKRHRMDKMQDFVFEAFSEEKFISSSQIVESFGKLVSRSSMVSVFDKMKLKDVQRAISEGEKEALAHGIALVVKGDMAGGLGLMISVLLPYKMAKWTILTCLGAYLRPDREVFVKPTTTKMVLQYFEISEFHYSPKASFAFYERYREMINDLKAQSDPRLQVNNPAYTAFLMMSLRL